MAWRDSRRNRSRLLLFISSIILGIAALVATFSFGYNSQQDINAQARMLVGADLVIESNRMPAAPVKSMLDSLGDDRSEERVFASMVYFLNSQSSRLVQVRALQGDYPYYGSLVTTPAGAGRSFLSGRQALVSKTLMMQYNARIGDSIKIGDLHFAISGVLNKAPGRNEISTTVAPPVYIPLRYLKEMDVQKRGSRIGYNFYYKYDSSEKVENILTALKPRFELDGLEYETVESRKKSTGRAFDDFNQFLTLISFIALLLGCIGVASSIHIYVREKVTSIAILRCLGVSSSQAFLIYLIQVTGIGLIGSILGALTGTLVQRLLPVILKDFLPIETTTTLSWPAIGQGIALGLLISLLFALLPLVGIRKVSPLHALRIPVEGKKQRPDPVKGMVYLLLAGLVTIFAHWQMHSWPKAIVFTSGVAGALLLLAGVALLLMWVLRRFFPTSWNYLWRQGFSNLYRPNNQTIILMITIGLGASFIGTLYFIQGMLIERVNISGRGSQPNMVLFDIQTSQKDAVVAMTRKFGLPVLQKVPIVTMRIESINGKTALQALGDTTRAFRRRAYESELRVTYRDSLLNTEKILAGSMGAPVREPGDLVRISLEDGYAKWLHVKIGDSIVFNVQGMPVVTVVGSIRDVDWRHLQTNFRIVFPTGVLEDAPQFYVVVTRVPSAETSGLFQRSVVNNFPNVSIIDLGLVLSVLDDVLDKIAFVIRFMAAFSIVTGLIVLIASVLISKYQRIQETVLLRTLGASRRQILVITALEYFFLGTLASATGLLLSIAASMALAKYNFDSSIRVNWLPLVTIFSSLTLLIILIGLINSREILNKAPLEILRNET